MASYRPTRPTTQNFVQKLYTFRDAVEHVLLAFDLDGSTKHSRYARNAVMQAYRNFPDDHTWNWYRRRAQITTVASQTTGTVAYTASTRTVTLSGATWPTDVRFYSLILNEQICKVQSRTSDTVIVLDPDMAPGSDIAAGTSYTLYRSIYPMPYDFRKGWELRPINDYQAPVYRPPQDLLEMMSFNYGPEDIADYYTIRQSSDFMGGMCIEFAPPPSTARVYDFYYTATPRPLQMFGSSMEYSTGTVTVSDSDETVVGSGTAFDSTMVGCVMRISENGDASLPTGQFGYDSLDNPYYEQRVVASVTDGTNLEADALWSADISGAKYTIGAPLDIEPESMLTAFLKLCEAEMSNLIRQKEAPVKREIYIRELRRAIAADQRNLSPMLTDVFPAQNLGDLKGGS